MISLFSSQTSLYDSEVFFSSDFISHSSFNGIKLCKNLKNIHYVRTEVATVVTITSMRFYAEKFTNVSEEGTASVFKVNEQVEKTASNKQHNCNP
jgi:hypothetical protein